jgi:hypothetical protein
MSGAREELSMVYALESHFSTDLIKSAGTRPVPFITTAIGLPGEAFGFTTTSSLATFSQVQKVIIIQT